MTTTSTIALSGLSAASRVVEVTAHNLANAQTPNYRRQFVQQQTAPGGGVTTSVATAPGEGEDLATDLVQQRAASYQFQANLKTLQTEQTMLGRLLDVKV